MDPPESSPVRTPYEVLGVSPDASPEEIRDAYWRLVRFHRTEGETAWTTTYLGEIQQSERVVSYPDRDKYHYDLDALRCACHGTGLTMSYNGDWGHPDNQKMVVFTRDADA